MDAKKHWSEISDDGAVDIKFIWEASRFSMVYSLARAYASTREEKFAEAFWELVQAWAVSNPPDTGPNWMDGQEAALRLLAWTFGFQAFLDSPSTTPQRMAQFTLMVAAHAERIYKNIAYAISTRSNHTISEAFGLWLVGLLFPELQEAQRYFSLGRKLLEEEAVKQIFPDGSYSMYSLNYHRFILHIYLLAMRLGELNQVPFSKLVHRRVSSSIDYLYQLIDPQTGQMPVYGSNDGALVLPLSNCDFTDYRPLLQLGWYLTKNELLFKPGPWDEDIFWLYGGQALTPPLSQRERGRLPSPHRRKVGVEGETNGGVCILPGAHSKAVICCTDFRARPSQADQLHVDLWWRDKNIACDAGTYLYSGKGIWRNGLAHTAVHNTVIVDETDQMEMLSRFTWTDWARGKVLQQAENLWQGEHNGYQKLSDPVTHKRTVLSLEGDRWLIVDYLAGKQTHHYALHWLLCDGNYEKVASTNGLWLIPALMDSKLSNSKIFIQMGLLEGNGSLSTVRADPNSTRGWRSRYYGEKEPAISAMLETDQSEVCFWTFFGFEDDVIQIAEKTFKLISGVSTTTVDLQSPVL